MFFRFSTEKLIQAAGVLLRQTRNRRMEYLRLLKLLYIADRRHLQQYHRPIIGNRLVAMKFGPLHSELYDLVKGEHIDEPLWSESIQKDNYEITLIKDAGVSELSAAEVRTLTETYELHQTMTEWDLVEITHDFPEWLKNFPDKTSNTANTISFDDLLDAVGLQNEKQPILDDLRESAELDRLFSTY